MAKAIKNILILFFCTFFVCVLTILFFTCSSYELSQDLLDKQIELLERKYGGIRARKAAVCIQRAFRHYKMVKKFASITAMAKADKRISNRCSMQSLISVGDESHQDIGGSQAGQKVCAM